MKSSSVIKVKLVFLKVMLVTCAFLQNAGASGDQYISVSNLNPFSIGLDQGNAYSSSSFTNKNYAIDLKLEIGNFSKQSTSGNEEIILDGETYKTTFYFYYGFNGQWQGSMSIPHIRHSSGLLDNVIEQWHDMAGLSNSRRSSFSSNRLHYEFLENGVSQVHVVNSVGGIGDINLALSYTPLSWQDKDNIRLINLDFKLPTGDPDRLTGNGAADLGLSVSLMKKNLFGSHRLTMTNGLGLKLHGEGKVLPLKQKGISYSLHSGIHWRPVKELTLSSQLALHSAYFESDLDELGKASTQLLLGGSFHVEDDMKCQFTLGENLFTDATPDLSLHIVVQLK